MVDQQIVPVILSGGSGTRLWPVSSSEAPKQFHRLITERSLIQDTALRVGKSEKVSFLPPVVITNVEQSGVVAAQLQSVGIDAGMIVLEPVGRNTAAAAAVAATVAAQRWPNALILLLPADHFIADEEGFREAVLEAAPFAGERFVTFGMAARTPDTGYGYITAGRGLGPRTFVIDQFLEKPSAAAAEALIARGGCFWNGGMFLLSPTELLAELHRFQPRIAECSALALEKATVKGDCLLLDAESFRESPSVSLDVAVMQKTSRGAVIACDIGWADIGSWSELWRLTRVSPDNNTVRGPVVAIDTQESLVWSDGISVASLGVRDLIIVASGNKVLVMPKSRAQDVRLVASAIAETAAEVAATDSEPEN